MAALHYITLNRHHDAHPNVRSYVVTAISVADLINIEVSCYSPSQIDNTSLAADPFCFVKIPDFLLRLFVDEYGVYDCILRVARTHVICVTRLRHGIHVLQYYSKYQ